MRTRFAKLSIVFALVLAVGGHWALLQSLAWVSMTINFSKTNTLDTALEKTFSGKNPCELCHFVAEGKRSERTKEFFKPETKLDLISAATFSLPTPTESPIEFTPLLVSAFARAEAPPSPPPRLA